MGKPKFNYKIFNNKTKTYYHCRSGKSVWQNKKSVANFINDLTSDKIDYFSGFKTKGTSIEEIEIHIFPIENAIVELACDFLNELKPNK